MKLCTSADRQCEEEGLRCNPSSSDVCIAAEEIGEGLGGWRACLPTPRGNTTHNQHSHDRWCPDASNPSDCCVQMHQTLTNCGNMHIESFVNNRTPCVPPMTKSLSQDFRQVENERTLKGCHSTFFHEKTTHVKQAQDSPWPESCSDKRARDGTRHLLSANTIYSCHNPIARVTPDNISLNRTSACSDGVVKEQRQFVA